MDKHDEWAQKIMAPLKGNAYYMENYMEKVAQALRYVERETRQETLNAVEATLPDDEDVRHAVHEVAGIGQTSTGHKEPCCFCGEDCDCLTSDPAKWPVGLCHSDEPGVIKWHHSGCVSDRLEDLMRMLRDGSEHTRLKTAAKALCDGLEICHICHGLLLLDDDNAAHCEDCSWDCDTHDEPNCTPLNVLVRNVRAAIESEEPHK